MSTIACHACGLDEDANLIDAACAGDPEVDDFDRMLCIGCYGPGYAMLSPEHAALSVQPALAPLYDAWVWQDRLRAVVWC